MVEIVLCIHRDRRQLSVLQDNGYELLTTATCRQALQLFMSQTVDAVLIDYHLEHLDGAAVATQIKQKRATVPIIRMADHKELPMKLCVRRCVREQVRRRGVSLGDSPLCPEREAGAAALRDGQG